ncbi:esterase/lipase family protein [Aporhodopirellula aestuarii]|uniref:Alpha/beta hydrolase n=1 Tax=Aporhodopirellula aestuarii TaxID=2950107 RepID=A0ABT0U1Z7_9BACT|nr:hypothetical protein [Aporhodopirellula aestuarii]MCM2370585.1 hypothetical protein [Aporhodopirellula aestuarii]
MHSGSETAVQSSEHLPTGDDNGSCPRIDRVLLIPGLMEPRTAMLPLKYRLRRYRNDVEIWRDRYMFRNVEKSVSRLADMISDDSSDQCFGIVTHSFGDWIARQAIASVKDHRVGALVSLAPVMGCGHIPKLMHLLGGDLIPEIAIISDREQAQAALDCDAKLKRMVIWAQIDFGVHRVDLSGLPDIDVRLAAATHLSVVMQPNVHTIIEKFLFGDEQPSINRWTNAKRQTAN